MRSFHQLDRIIGRVPAGVVNQLRVIDTGRGSEALHRDQLPGLLETLSRRARVASVTTTLIGHGAAGEAEIMAGCGFSPDRRPTRI